MSGTSGSVSLRRWVPAQVIFASTALPAGTPTRIPPSYPAGGADYVVPETGLYQVIADTRASINAPANSSGWVTAYVTVNGAKYGGTEHLPLHLNSINGGARGENGGAGINFLINLNAGDTVGLGALFTVQAGAPNAAINTDANGYTRLLIERVR